MFWTLDTNRGYLQVEIDKIDRDKTAFTSHYDSFRLSGMPFGLCNGPDTFQQEAHVILLPIRWQLALVHFEDIIMISHNAGEHIWHVYTVLLLLHKAGVTLILKKCIFFTENNDYLGGVIRPGNLELADHTTEEIRDLKSQGHVAELKYFLGLCNVYRRFIPNYARIRAPLYYKLKRRRTKDVAKPYTGGERHISDYTVKAGISTSSRLTTQKRTFDP